MHIPDGYLSPQTCAALYAVATPFWIVALRRVKKMLSTRFLPLLSVFAAFSFVVMMFNLPLPGGTTGHAVGMGVAAIVLGPWAAILAVSTALVIQALFFGDGGITAIGANCFNMAIVGSLAAWCVYRLAARGAPLASRRRVIAAALAGYVAINLSALCAAIEFGIQPALFHDAAGTPLYCPYPLSIAVPAMMIGHLTFAGLAELVITAGIVAYLQRANPELLEQRAPRHATPVLRRLWLTLVALIVLTPLGILTVGSAWGEWSAADFADANARQEIARASGHRAPPAQPPTGLARLSSLWNAPLADYAPGFIHYPSLGYLVSAAAGVALIVLAMWLVPRGGFIERTVRSLLEATEYALFAEEIARSPGVLQSLDARIKLAGVFSLIMAAMLVHSPPVLIMLFALAPLAALVSHVPLPFLALRVWLPALAFSGVLAIPAIFLTPGTVIYRLPLLGWPLTLQGAKSVLLLLLRVETAVTFCSLLILTTEWARVLRALRFFRMPVTAVAILGMTYRYNFLLLRTAREMFDSRRSRFIGDLPAGERRRLAAASAGVLLTKSFELSADVHSAMRARGFSGEVYLLDEPKLGARDWMHFGCILATAAAFIVLGR